MQNEKVICNKFSFAYDSNTFGIHDIDLTIQEGEFIVLTGKSGCGKTTLTRCINGLIPDFFEGTITGSCRVCGMDISEHEQGTIPLMLVVCFKTRVHSFSRSM